MNKTSSNEWIRELYRCSYRQICHLLTPVSSLYAQLSCLHICWMYVRVVQILSSDSWREKQISEFPKMSKYFFALTRPQSQNVNFAHNMSQNLRADWHANGPATCSQRALQSVTHFNSMRCCENCSLSESLARLQTLKCTLHRSQKSECSTVFEFHLKTTLCVVSDWAAISFMLWGAEFGLSTAGGRRGWEQFELRYEQKNGTLLVFKSIHPFGGWWHNFSGE